MKPSKAQLDVLIPLSQGAIAVAKYERAVYDLKRDGQQIMSIPMMTTNALLRRAWVESTWNAHERKWYLTVTDTGRKAMTMTKINVVAKHIRPDKSGRAWIIGADIGVIDVVMDKLVRGWSPETIHVQRPHLSLAQIHAALSYYYTHKEQMDAEIVHQEQRKDPQ